MAKNPAWRLALAAFGALLAGACATQPTTPLLERKFQQTAAQYQRFQHEGKVVYCKKGAVPKCITEDGLRRQVEDHERNRNSVSYWRSPPG